MQTLLFGLLLTAFLVCTTALEEDLDVRAFDQDTPSRSFPQYTTLVSVMSEKVSMQSRIAASIKCMAIGDALAMPAHWYYSVDALKRQYGRITDYVAPKHPHPTSIMNLANTGGPCRGSNKGNVIGDVILHDKKKFWGPPGVHYHQSLQAGENTLNFLVTRLLLRQIAEEEGYSTKSFLDAYVKFMTTPGTHNDTYAESYHRAFFENWSRGVPPEKCAGKENHDTASMGGLVMLPPLLVLFREREREEAKELVLKHLRLTHQSRELEKSVRVFSDFFLDVLEGKDLVDSAQEAGRKLGVDIKRMVSEVKKRGLDDTAVVGGTFGTACYISDSLPSLLYLAARHHDSIEDALISNVNVGGENCHRGAVLGAVMGAALGPEKIPQRWITGLKAGKELDQEISTFLRVAFSAKEE